ncbi:MAG: Crp/Fnr family transcriptional regulator [Phycisphaerae bacterium]
MSVSPDELSRCPLFSSHRAEELLRLGELARERHVSNGEIVFREGQPCEGFFIVLAGCVRVFKVGPDGRERILHLVQPPHAFAEAAMFGRAVYPAHAEAAHDSRLALIPRQPFLNLLEHETGAAIKMVESLSVWLHRLLDQLEDQTFLNARSRLANYVLREARRHNGDSQPERIHLTPSKKDVASMLGMAPETLSRALADLEGRGLLRIQGPILSSLDAEGLEQLLLGVSPTDRP